ncbi:DUF453-domain-containing protein [Xylariaceae sp. FL1019]|nr:DUF453-domain-containing protein [Xylariaceae sp. FL1019]
MRRGPVEPVLTCTLHLAAPRAPRSYGSKSLREPQGHRSLPALFVRSGTSNGLVLRASDLPADQGAWCDILPAAMGAPDSAYGRQLDGMGGGSSSTSKICVLAPSSRDDADVDFTTVQVGIRDGRLDLAGNCGNMSAIVGPIAWDWGFAKGQDVTDGQEEAAVRIFNTNTSKIIHSRFRVGGTSLQYRSDGDYVLDGVPGTQSRITLSFVDPAGAKTGKALPTGNPVDVLELSDGTSIRASLVDVSNPGVFVALEELLGVDHDIYSPAAIESNQRLKERLEMIRRAGAARMGLNPDVESVPKIVLVYQPENGTDLDIRCLAMSMGQAHKAAPLTLSLCLGAATSMDGTIPAQVCRKRKESEAAGGQQRSVIIGHPSGSVEIGAKFENGKIVSAELHRTARVMMKGEVYY